MQLLEEHLSLLKHIGGLSKHASFEISPLKPLEIDLTQLVSTKGTKNSHNYFQPALHNNFDKDLIDDTKTKYETYKPEVIDLSLIKEHGDVKYSEPDKFIQSSHQLTKDELDHFYKDYDKYEKYRNTKPIVELEGGFKPIYNTKNRVTQPRFRPGLIKTGKKPYTTPGLKNYSGQRGYLNYVFPPTQSTLSSKSPRFNYSNYYNPKGPILFPPTPEENVQKSAEVPKLYQNLANGFMRYAKHIVRF